MPDRIEALIAATKSLSDVPAWVLSGADDLGFTAPLEVDGVTVEGLTLRARARKSLADREVIFQLEYHHSQGGGPVARIEWNPLNAHSNKGLGPKHLRHLIQKGSHLHCFDLNWRHSQEGVLKGLLPIAIPINEEPQNFRALLGVVGTTFRINNAQLVTAPPWEPTML